MNRHSSYTSTSSPTARTERMSFRNSPTQRPITRRRTDILPQPRARLTETFGDESDDSCSETNRTAEIVSDTNTVRISKSWYEKGLEKVEYNNKIAVLERQCRAISWKGVALIALALFYVLFASMLKSLLSENRDKGTNGVLECETSPEMLLIRWENLEKSVKAEVFGQHIALEATLRTLYSHFMDDGSKKALALSFHGGSGTGKSLLANLIVNNFFPGGLKSSFVHIFFGSRHFLGNTAEDSVNQAEKLVNTIEERVKLCPRSIFIFDEAEKMPHKVFDRISPFLGHNSYVDGVDYTKATFIFISSSGAGLINNITTNYILEGGRREMLTILDFQLPLIHELAKEDGLFKSELYKQNLIDHYIPFLPLERNHVISCAMFEIKRRKALYIDPLKIADRVKYIPSENERFAQNGCKNIMSHVAYYVHDFMGKIGQGH